MAGSFLWARYPCIAPTAAGSIGSWTVVMPDATHQSRCITTNRNKSPLMTPAPSTLNHPESSALNHPAPSNLHSLCNERPSVRLQGYLAHKNPPLLGPFSRPIPRALWWSKGGGLFLMSEVPLYGGLEYYSGIFIIYKLGPRKCSTPNDHYW